MARVVVGRAWGDTRAQRMTRLLGVARRDVAWRDTTRRGTARRDAHGVAADRSEGSLACSRAPLLAATCGHLLFPSSSRSPLALSRSASFSRASCLRLFIALFLFFSLSRFIA